MDHNLGDALNLDSAMGVEFVHSEDAVVNQADIALEDSDHGGGMPMEFEHIEEQPMLMDTGSEEIIDFMGEQFTLQAYTENEDQTNVLTSTVDSSQHNILTSQSDTMIEMEVKPHKIISNEDHTLPKIVPAKTTFTSPTRTGIKKSEPEVYTSAPRQVAIAPKPPVLVQGSKAYVPGKQFAIAPKPVTLVTRKNNSCLKKVTLASVMQGNTKGNVLTQIGKQFVMMSAEGPQKLKLVSGTGVPTVQYIRAAEQATLIQNKNVGMHNNKPMMTKLIVQGQSNVDVNSQPTIITKVTPVAGVKSPTRFVTMQQKTVPLSLGNKVLLATPTKSGVKFAKKQQIIAFKSPEKVLQAAQGSTTKKVVITSNPSQNVILKTTAPPKTAQITKDGNIIVEGQRTQLHQINVPGKGIQYIRLITNSAPASSKSKNQPQTINVPAKTFMLADNKGNLIQMSAEKIVSSGQPPPLVLTGNKITTKPQQKLVRIAPLVPKPAQSVATSRSSQSLLAPLSPMSEVPQSAPSDVVAEEQEEIDSKEALHALVADALKEDAQFDVQLDTQRDTQMYTQLDTQFNTQLDTQLDTQPDTQDPQVSLSEVVVEFKRDFVSEYDEKNNSMDRRDSSDRSEEHPLIVIPHNYMKDADSMDMSNNQSMHDDSQRTNSILSMDADVLNAYQSPRTPQAVSETDMAPTELGLRPRKACNCTKSQCLKLYCDCFANGEFCNRCNCNNCRNNLEHEELRQRAIRGCLDRNPNAFRPKIGKSKIGGPDIIRRHNKGCNCKRSGCLKNYCECYEAKIACTAMCKCVGCRNVEETLERTRRRDRTPAALAAAHPHPHPLSRPPVLHIKQPCSFMTTEVIEAVCQCLLAAGAEAEGSAGDGGAGGDDPTRDVIEEFARCLQDIISAAHHSSPLALLDESPA